MSKTGICSNAGQIADPSASPIQSPIKRPITPGVQLPSPAAPGEGGLPPQPGEIPYALFADLVAESAHDLNNALGSLHLYLGLLELEADSGDRVRQRLQEIRPVVQHAVDLARELGEPGTVEGARARKTFLNPVLQRLVPMLSGILPENVALRLHLAPDLAAISIDPAHLVRIVSNLVLNSRDALLRAPNRVGAEVTLETAIWRVAVSSSTPSSVERSSRVKRSGDERSPDERSGEDASGDEGSGNQPSPSNSHLGSTQDSGWVLLRVRDTGPGMAETTRARMFQPFFTTKPSGKGSGLGLSSVLRMVQRAGGTIQVESGPDKGTDFTILFPSAGSRRGKLRLQPNGAASAKSASAESMHSEAPTENSRPECFSR